MTNYYWTITPYIYETFSLNKYVTSSGVLSSSGTSSSYGVRPVISLKAGMGYAVGDGSMTNPYIVVTE